MTTLQTIFKRSYTASLADAIRTEEGRRRYLADTFECDLTQTVTLRGIEHPEGLLDRMMAAEEEVDTAIILYEAYKNLPLVVAVSEPFWAYLVHVDLYPYCKKRWPIKDDEDYLNNHYFMKHPMRNALASLWLSVHFTIDPNRKDPYELTRVFFLNETLRTRTLTVFLRYKEGMLGVLEFINTNPKLFKRSREKRCRYLARYFNRLGATKHLASQNREFFIRACYSIKDNIAQIFNDEDLKKVLGEN
jgi:hypothetical protein